MNNPKIYVIGESHTRSYSHRNNMVPIFMGSGRSINLYEIEVIKKKVNRILDSIEEGSIVCFLLGEPDCRYQLGYGWDVCYESTVPPLLSRKLRFVPSSVNEKYLNTAINNYLNLLDSVSHRNFKFAVISICGVYYPVIPAIKYCNKKLKEEIKSRANVEYLEIFEKFLIDNGTKVDPSFADPNPVRDCIHINSKASDFLLTELVEVFGIHKKRYNRLSGNYSSRDVIEIFKFNEKFGSYTI